MTKSEIQSVLRMSKLLSYMSNDFKTYRFKMVDLLDDDEEAESKQRVLDDHELKVMELIDRIGELIGEPFQTKTSSDTDFLENLQPSVPAPASTNDRLVNRHLDLLWNSVQTIRRAVKNPDFADAHVLRSYQNKIESRRRAARVQEKDLLLIGHCVQRASDIDGTMFDLRVAISWMMERMKKEPTPLAYGMLMVGGVNLPQIEVLNFDGVTVESQLSEHRLSKFSIIQTDK